MARYWSDRPRGVKLAVLVAAGAVALAVFAVIAVRALQATGERADALLAANEGTGLALEADMMHDAVRADVLQALLGGGGGEQYQGAASSLQQHAASFRDVLDTIAAAHLSAEAAALAAGDLRGSTGVTSRDQVGRMAAALHSSISRFRC